jgi:hypothetical protein
MVPIPAELYVLIDEGENIKYNSSFPGGVFYLVFNQKHEH